MHMIEHRDDLKDRIEINLNKTSFKPGETVSVRVNLYFYKPIKAKELKISFIGEKEIEYYARNSSRKSSVPFYIKELINDNKGSFFNQSYDFDFSLPNDILEKAEMEDATGYAFVGNRRYKLSKRMAALQKRSMEFAFSSGLDEIKKNNKWCISVSLKIPYKPDIDVDKEIEIT